MARSGVAPELSGAGLPNNYKFLQVHFHWGIDSSKGSEHTVDGKAYPMEMHLVHYKADLASSAEATEKDDLAVLGIFFRVSTNLLFERIDLCSALEP